MFPTDEADQRAELCLSCHLGDNKSARFVTHRMMAAGHPRTTFELATFTLTQPAHFVVDEDYRQRGKAVSSAAKTWVIGQLVAARLWLSLVGSSGSSHDGSWPEFTLYDCDSCHQLISPAGVSEVSTTAGDLGFPRPAWDSLLTAQLILATVGARGAGELKQVIAEIERLRPSRDLAAAAAPATRGTRVIDEVLARMNDDSKSQPHDQLMDEASLHKMLAALAERSTGGLSYAVATQRYMAAQSLVATIEKTDRLQVHHPTETGDRSLSGALAPLYGAVQNSTTYTPDRFRAALAHLIASTPQ